MSMKNAQVADLLEAVADYVEALEGDHLARKAASTAEKVEKIAGSYQESTGETLSEALRQKLATADDALLDLFVERARTAGGSPDSLGGPAETATEKVASHDPDEKLLAWIMS